MTTPTQPAPARAVDPRRPDRPVQASLPGETLAREIERALRKEGERSVIMLDVDHFKRFSDTRGHEAGDVVLAAVGQLLRARGGRDRVAMAHPMETRS